MNIAELPPPHVLNSLGPVALTALGVTGALAILGGFVLFGQGESRWARLGALALGLLGLAAIEGVFWLVRAQTVMRFYQNLNLRVAGLLYSNPTRLWALVGMVAAPILTAVAAVSFWRWTRLNQSEDLPYHYKEGLRHFFHRDYEAALIEFTAAIKLAPEKGEAYCKRGGAFARLGAHDMALADLGRALARDPRLADAYLERGGVRTALGDYDGALADFEQVFSLRPVDAECHLQRGVCLMKKGASYEASAEFEKVLRMTNHPDVAEPAHRYLGELGPGVTVGPSPFH